VYNIFLSTSMPADGTLSHQVITILIYTLNIHRSATLIHVPHTVPFM
jgi:hypothetical protein